MSSPAISADRGLKLRDVLPQAQLVGAQDVQFRSCCGQWQECQPDDLFVAIVDSEEDGHDFTQEAVNRGAQAVVTERLLTTGKPQCIVPDSREAYGRICQALAGHPSRRLTTIGVSGSDGKTVTSHLIHQVLQSAERRAGLSSSIEVCLGNGETSVPFAELTSPRLAEQLTRTALAASSDMILEVPSVALAKRSLAGVELDVAVLTNIRFDQRDFHGSPANYRRAQLRLLHQLKPQGVAVLNADDPTTCELADSIPFPFLTFGIRQEAHVTAELIERSLHSQTFLIQAGGDSVPIETQVIGDQHILNCLAAVTVGLAVGLDLSTATQGLSQVNSLPGRMERVECGQDFGVWIDSARSPNQLATALNSLRQECPGKVWCVCSANESESAEQRKRFGEIVERSAEEVVLTKAYLDDDRDYEPVHQLLDGFDNPGAPQVLPNRFKAIEWVLSQAQPGDAVLIAGCGERSFALFGEENWTISDRDVCEAWLYDHASLAPQTGPLDGLDQEDSIFNIDDYR